MTSRPWQLVSHLISKFGKEKDFKRGTVLSPNWGTFNFPDEMDTFLLEFVKENWPHSKRDDEGHQGQLVVIKGEMMAMTFVYSMRCLVKSSCTSNDAYGRRQQHRLPA